MKEEARALALPRAPVPARASDRSEESVETARHNARSAGVAGDLLLSVADARDARPDGEGGTVCTNPPYGERVGGRPLELGGFYRGIGEALRRFSGWSAVILSGNPQLEREIGLHPEWTHPLWNGPLETRLLRYRIP
jgi:putative N6-adenine-specific DNA methylase